MSRNSMGGKPYIVDGDMEADIAGGAIDCIDHENLRLQCSWTDTASPVGVMYVQGSEDGVTYRDCALTSAMLTGLTADATLSSGALALDGTAAGGVIINIKDPFRYMRVFWDVTTGGAADLLQVIAGAR